MSALRFLSNDTLVDMIEELMAVVQEQEIAIAELQLRIDEKGKPAQKTKPSPLSEEERKCPDCGDIECLCDCTDWPCPYCHDQTCYGSCVDY